MHCMYYMCICITIMCVYIIYMCVCVCVYFACVRDKPEAWIILGNTLSLNCTPSAYYLLHPNSGRYFSNFSEVVFYQRSRMMYAGFLSLEYDSFSFYFSSLMSEVDCLEFGA